MDIQQLKNKYPVQTGKDNPTLRQESEPIENIDDEIREFGNNLLKLMMEYDGIGLAAPQVGEHIRMVAVGQYDKGGYGMKSKQIMINPQVTYKSDKTQVQEEACLSLPGIQGDVKRANAVKIQYTDLDGQNQTISADGLNASVLLHEIDHLDGVLFVDKIKSKDKSNLNLEKFVSL